MPARCAPPSQSLTARAAVLAYAARAADAEEREATERMTMRVAYFPDSFHEVNGVAHTSRNFVAYAERHQLPFLCVRAADRQRLQGRESVETRCGAVHALDLARSRTAGRLEKDLVFDAIFWRHYQAIEWALKRFEPDVVHITGPSELGLLGALLAAKLGIPLAASWHTNVHEYLARRTQASLRGLPGSVLVDTSRVGAAVEQATLTAAMQLYRRAQVLFAPNHELCTLLTQRTGTLCHPMRRGVDTTLFTPSRRRRGDDGKLVLGYVGRLSVEKNIALLVDVMQQLKANGVQHVTLRIVGQGGDEAWLRRHLPQAEFAGVLRGEALADAYADMDVFLFPSHTDTFGNVVLEALASGVPAVVTRSGGPKSIVRNGITGVVVDDDGFAGAVQQFLREPTRRLAMSAAAREYALGCSWDAVFDGVYGAYRHAGLVRQ